MRGLHMENLVLGKDDLKSEVGIKTLCYPRALLIWTLSTSPQRSNNFTFFDISRLTSRYSSRHEFSPHRGGLCGRTGRLHLWL